MIGRLTAQLREDILRLPHKYLDLIVDMLPVPAYSFICILESCNRGLSNYRGCFFGIGPAAFLVVLFDGHLRTILNKKMSLMSVGYELPKRIGAFLLIMLDCGHNPRCCSRRDCE